MLNAVLSARIHTAPEAELRGHQLELQKKADVFALCVRPLHRPLTLPQRCPTRCPCWPAVRFAPLLF